MASCSDTSLLASPSRTTDSIITASLPTTPESGVSFVDHAKVASFTRKRMLVACLSLVLHIEANTSHHVSNSDSWLAFDVALAIILQSQSSPILDLYVSSAVEQWLVVWF
jgi:hypothetical protein